MNISNQKVLGLITARGGSKGIPRKNIKMIAGKPLIVWTIEAALESSLLSEVVVSTDDLEIAEVARRAGAKVPFIRPLELAQDQTPGLAPVLHALYQLPKFDSVLLLQPTSPLRTSVDIDGLLNMVAQKKTLSAVSVTEADHHPYWTYCLNADQTMAPLVGGGAVARRQDLPAVFSLNGAMYFANANWLRESGSFVNAETLAYVMSKEHSVDLDTPLDWKFAELLLKELS